MHRAVKDVVLPHGGDSQAAKRGIVLLRQGEASGNGAELDLVEVVGR